MHEFSPTVHQNALYNKTVDIRTLASGGHNSHLKLTCHIVHSHPSNERDS